MDDITKTPDAKLRGELVRRWDAGHFVRHTDHSRDFWAEIKRLRGEGQLRAPLTARPTTAETFGLVDVSSQAGKTPVRRRR